MNYRTFGRLGWEVSEVGYGMWGIAVGEGGWTGSADEQGMQALQLAVDNPVIAKCGSAPGIGMKMQHRAPP